MSVRIPRLMVAGVASGVGKTTIACGLMRAFVQRGLRVQAAKVGPDYLDPMFHTQVLGVPSRNLDLFLGSERLVRELLADGARDADLTLIEGAMGYYDGIAQSDEASAYALARVTVTPVVLVVDARGRALSMAAEVAGFLRFRQPSQVAGVILSRVSAAYYPAAKAMLERETGVTVLGYLPPLAEATLESRHLGLVAAPEVDDLRVRIDAMAATMAETVDLDALLALVRAADELVVPRSTTSRADAQGLAAVAYENDEAKDNDALGQGEMAPMEPAPGAPHPAQTFAPESPYQPAAPSASAQPTIAVAQDAAFNFYYHDTLRLLERLGARLVPFSPLSDRQLPSGTCGLYLGGGYPELHAQALSANEPLRDELCAAIANGLPTIAECGGFLYLHASMEDTDGATWPMVGAVPGHAFRRERLVRFGYATLEAREDSLLAARGERLRAHEFHYWDSTHPGSAFHATKPQGTRNWDCVVATPTLYAGFPHLYLPGHPEAARRFVAACARVAQGAGEGRRAT